MDNREVISLCFKSLAISNQWPPLENEFVNDVAGPWCELDFSPVSLVHHVAQLVSSDVLHNIFNFIQVQVEVDVLLGEEHVVHFVLAPVGVRVCNVVDLGEVDEVVHRELRGADAQLLLQLADGGPLAAQCGGLVLVVGARLQHIRAQLRGHAQRVAAARVGPVPGERDLVPRALLQQEPALCVKEEYGESPMELQPVRHQMSFCLACLSNHFVVPVHSYHPLFHHLDLLVIVLPNEVL
mmetsp:Transcript_11360/g.16755  ORF Transcript_11360/g.16755 Transcript_11360/m.16755 type:complete len:239 (-) Transcript_11360:272-988(-)